MVRKSAKSVKIDTNVRCNRIYPVEGTEKNVSELKTVGMKLFWEGQMFNRMLPAGVGLQNITLPELRP